MFKFIHRRRGIASLEFVMCLPFIVLVTAIIFRIGIAALTKAEVAIDVRREVWQARDDQSGSASALTTLNKDSTTALAITSFLDPVDGKIDGEKNKTVANYSWLGGNKTAVSKTAIVASTWDYRDLEILDDGLPHIEFIPQILGAGGVADTVSSIKDKLAWLFSVLRGERLPLGEEAEKEIDGANEEQAEAEAEFEGKRQELVDQKAEAEADLAEKVAERQAYLDEQAELNTEKGQKETLLSQLLSQAQDLDPVPPALQQQIDDTRARLGEINGRLNVIGQEITRLNEEIDLLEFTIEKLQESIDDIDEVLNGD